MGRFKGKLICCDIDGTLINDDMLIPKNNLNAIEYFRKEGGLFTVATGRTIFGAAMYLDEIKPDTPIICQNGGAVYDYYKKQNLWYSSLPDSARKVVEYVEGKFPFVGIEILTRDTVYYSRGNYYTTLHKTQEFFEAINKNWRDIDEPWTKVLFAQSPEESDVLQADLENHSFYSDYRIMRSAPIYYEFIEKNSNKWQAIKILSDIKGHDISSIITVGDNDNDDTMLAGANLSFAPISASKTAKDNAKTILKSSNNQGIIEEIIGLL